MRRPISPAGLNYEASVKHLAFFKTCYFGFVFERPYPEATPAVDKIFRNPDLMWVPVDETREEVTEGNRKACRHADATIEALAIDAVSMVRSQTNVFVSVMAHRARGDAPRFRPRALSPSTAAVGQGRRTAFLHGGSRPRPAVASHREGSTCCRRPASGPAVRWAPTSLVHDRFRLEPLGPQHNEADPAAWMSSIETHSCHSRAIRMGNGLSW